MVKMTMKLFKRFFFHKINNNKENQRRNVLYIRGYDATQNFVTS